MAKQPPDSQSSNDWLDRLLQQTFGTDPVAEPRIVSEARDLEGVLATATMAMNLGGEGHGEPWPALAPESRYEVLEVAARGGLGIVYRGHDRDLGREVALKALDHRLASDPGFVRRFIDEAQVCSRLQHPGVVPVHELGLDQTQRPFFVMKLITGQTFAEVLAARAKVSDDRRRCLDAFEKVCQTVAYAHRQGVVHRDLKPANVMIGAFGEVQVVDWGLALVLGEPKGDADRARTALSVLATGRAPTAAGTAAGTPGYMPPEQARGETARVDARSDVFALGALLSEILTGVPVHAHELDSRTQIERTARGDFSGVQERLRECGAEPELVALALACLMPAMDDRPASAAAIAKALGDHLSSIDERSRQAQLRAVAARTRAKATLMVATLAVIVLAAGSGAFIWWREDNHQRLLAAVTQIDAAAADVVRLTERARADESLDGGAWDQARLAAHQAVQLTAALPVSDATRERIRQMELDVERDQEVARLRAERRRVDQEMVHSLVKIRHFNFYVEPRTRQLALANNSRATFAGYLEIPDLLALTTDDAVEALRSSIQLELAIGLDLWSLALTQSSDPRLQVRPAGFGPWLLALARWSADHRSAARLQLIARRLDPGDATRTQLRDLIMNRDEAELVRIATEVDSTTISISSMVLLAELCVRDGAMKHATAVYKRACDLHPHDLGVAIGAATCLSSSGSFESAVEYWRIARALDRDYGSSLNVPYYVRVRAALAECLQLSGRQEEAIACLQQVLVLEPTYSNGAIRLAALLIDQHKRDEAEAVLEHCASELMTATIGDPENLQLALDLAQIRLKQKRHQEAVELLHSRLSKPWSRTGTHRDLAIKNHLAHGYYLLGVALASVGQVEDGAIWLRRCLRLDPSHWDASMMLGAILKGNEQLEEAVHLMRRAVASRPRSAEFSARLAAALAQLGRSEEATSYAERAIALGPPSRETRAFLGTALVELGRLAEAIEYLESADTELGLVRFSLHNIAWKIVDPDAKNETRDLALALRAAEKLAELTDRQDPHVLDTLAKIYVWQGEFAKATDLQTRAIELQREVIKRQERLETEVGRQVNERTKTRNLQNIWLMGELEKSLEWIQLKARE
jgi:tetratricopeptide (TPR) repeat protein